MTALKEKETMYFRLTNLGSILIGLSLKDIKNKFPDNPICFIEYYEKIELGNIVEIRFDEEKVTLTCTLNKEKICNSTYLFFDEHCDVLDYMEYIKNTFSYDYLGCRWLLHNCFMTTKKIDGIIGFMFYKIDQSTS